MRLGLVHQTVHVNITSAGVLQHPERLLLMRRVAGPDPEQQAAVIELVLQTSGMPVSDVVFSVLSLDTEEVTVSTGTLTFTSANWDTPQTVTVTGVDDLLNDGDQFTIASPR